jgi:uncharacterized membrane protein YfcA
MEIFIILSLFVVALFYSSVGHGGASGYLATMALLSIAPETMKSTALILNLFVAGIAFVSFYKANYFKFRILWPFVATSMPAAYIGAKITINPSVYKIILGIFLLIAVARMLYKPNKSDKKPGSPIPVFYALIIGAGLGFFSGMIGIGGGIILSPLLILLNWASIKEAAAVSAPFIFLNSLSGLLGLLQKGFVPEAHTVLWIIAATIGGIIGSYLGSHKFSIAGLKYILAGILCLAAFKLFIV